MGQNIVAYAKALRQKGQVAVGTLLVTLHGLRVELIDEETL